ncbi:MAG: aminodeoxychorismate synthase component I [Chloroflexi bacterium]|nr:aminodeoxychorismate synthase component I [Chloroflexota bacterium]
MTKVGNIFIEEISTTLSAPQAFELFRDRPFCFFLDSGMDHQNLGRYSFIGSDPFLIMKSRGKNIEIIRGTEKTRISGNPFDVLGELMKSYHIEEKSLPVPFTGGVVGYFSYDLCHFIERLPAKAFDDIRAPECYLCFYNSVLAYDHLLNKVYITYLPFSEKDNIAVTKLKKLKNKLLTTIERNNVPEQKLKLKLSANFTHENYIKAVEEAREYIKSGDIFEVNISQRFSVDLPIEPFQLYKRLRMLNPAPFACYLDFGDISVVSSSPERYLRLRSNIVETRPIKGTRPRGKNELGDKALAEELLNSSKDRAEHMMIVDLERNDLGRVCSFGSVRVKELTVIEKYATVFQMVSTIEGKLMEGKNSVDLLKATFPGGSITGAPKVRAMEIIDELEPTKRSVYTGNIGYLGFNGDMDLNIVIRTFIIKDKRAYFQVGGAVTYDSDAEAEYQETIDKARALLKALDLQPEAVRGV